MIQSPCYDRKAKQDCPRRHVGCVAACPEWAEYEKKKQEEYASRQTKGLGRYNKESSYLKEKIRQRRRIRK